MSRGSSGHKPNYAAQRNRARYKAAGRTLLNKKRKARKEEKLQQNLLTKGKGVYAKNFILAGALKRGKV